MSQNFRLFLASNLSVLNFRIFLLVYPGSVYGFGREAEQARTSVRAKGGDDPGGN